MATRTPEAETTTELQLDAEQTAVLATADLREHDEETELPAFRLAIAVSFSALAAAVMVGGIYLGIGPRVWAAVAAVLGAVLGVYARKIANPIGSNLAIIGGLFAIGIVLTLPAGSLGDVTNLAPFVREAVTSGDVLRPPVEFTLGWRAIVSWLMAGIGFASAWVAIELRKPVIGLLVPLPVVAVSAISVPSDAKLASGIVALGLFAAGLGLLSGVEVEDAGEQRSLAFELRRAARAVPMILVITLSLWGLSRVGFLFPRPLYDPTQSAQKPKTVPLTEVPDRVLFTVESQITGPWRMGSLDVYDGEDWRLPPFAESRLAPVPASGIVDSELTRGVRATFDVKDLGGAILPGLPNIVGLVAQRAPAGLAYDSRTGVVRLGQGQVQPGLKYTVVAARIPTVEELRESGAEPPPDIAERFLDGMPPAPRAVVDLMARAPKLSKWDTLDFMRQEFLKNVVAAGPGVPKSVPPERVQDMLAGSKEGTPFEIVAAQAMLARWAGVPARIGYGFDGGDKLGNLVEVRPRHGASFLEVWFPGFKWLPVIGSPLQARSTFGGEQTQQERQTLPSNDIATQVFIPFETDPQSYLFQQIRAIVVVVVPIILLALLLYYTWPFFRKAWARSRRRTWAAEHGPAARIALAYAEWRDLCTDFGYRHPADTPLMFLDRVVPDEEHAELAWLVTRTLWGDLRADLTDEDAVAAEELSRAMRRRMSAAHPWTLRTIAAISRLSIRTPYAPSLGATTDRRPARVAA